MKEKLTIMIILFAILFSACGPAVTTTKMDPEDLDNYSTFAYLPNSNFDKVDKFDVDENVGENIINRVNRNMRQKGYNMDRKNPDLLVLLSTVTDIEKTITKEPVHATYPGYYGNAYSVSPYYNNYYYYGYNDYNNIVGYEKDINKFKEGTLILSLVDSETKQMVWQATASDYIKMYNGSRATASFVDDVFEAFPEVEQSIN